MTARCKRCTAVLLRNYDTLICLNCGTMAEPRYQAGDALETVPRGDRKALKLATL